MVPSRSDTSACACGIQIVVTGERLAIVTDMPDKYAGGNKSRVVGQPSWIGRFQTETLALAIGIIGPLDEILTSTIDNTSRIVEVEICENVDAIILLDEQRHTQNIFLAIVGFGAINILLRASVGALPCISRMKRAIFYK